MLRHRIGLAEPTCVGPNPPGPLSGGKKTMNWIGLAALVCCVLGFAPRAEAADVVLAAAGRVYAHPPAGWAVKMDRFDRVATRVLAAVPHPPSARFVLSADQASINAAATFGWVMVSNGMMDFVRSDDELAMIVGHELAHLTEGHVSRGATNAVLLQLGRALAEAAIPGSGLATGVVGRMFMNHFNQSQELAADRVGMEYAVRAGYDPAAGEEVMRRMSVEVPESATAHFFSSHPSSVERAAALRRLAERHARRAPAAEPAPRPGRFGRDEDACRKARPVFYQALASTDPARKIDLYHRGLRQCPQSPRAHFELAEAYTAQGRHERAAAELLEVLRYDPTYPEAQTRLREAQRRAASGRDRRKRKDG